MYCTVVGCSKQLRSHNVIGVCRDHRGHSPEYQQMKRLAARRLSRKPAYKEKAKARRGQESWKEWRRRYDRLAMGITNATGEARSGTCPICQGQFEKLVCDHDHETGKTRGWLCRRCNSGIGMFRERLEFIRAAVAYLEASRG